MASRSREAEAQPVTMPLVRCAIYTRKSTDENLDSDFNSLHAQREAGENYIRSQQNEGWVALPETYDDGAYSGANIERPALQRLMRDVRAGRVDTIVVYKIDRLTRSLIDFGRLVEELERHDVSLVSVTQQFNTTSSMGRLTLNILLSFAQFEREVTAERIRDKLAAARKKGKYVGGIPPYGYDVDRGRKLLIVNPEEAVVVRFIFRRYLQLDNVVDLVRELNEKGHLTKSWVTKKGKERKGKPWHKNHIYRMIRNPVYIGKVQYKDEVYDGEHEAIVDQELWDKVQKAVAVPARTRANRNRSETPALLKGILRCGHCGTSMAVSFTGGRGRKYRYYVCHRASRTSYENCPVRSVGAGIIEEMVKDQLRKVFGSSQVVDHTLAALQRRLEEDRTQTESEVARVEKDIADVETCAQRLLETLRLEENDFVRSELSRLDERKRVLGIQLRAAQEKAQGLADPLADRDALESELSSLENIWGNLFPGEQQRLVRTVIRQVVVYFDRVEITVRGDGLQSVADLILGERAPSRQDQPADSGPDTTITLPIQFKRRGGRKEIILPDQQVESPHTRSFLVTYARALRWSELLEQGTYPTVKALAAAVGLERSYVARLLNLTLLSPRLIEAAVAGDDPEGLSLTKLRKRLPAAWEEQEAFLRGDAPTLRK